MNSIRESDLFRSDIESPEQFKPEDTVRKESEENPEKLNFSFPERNDAEHTATPGLLHNIENKGILGRFSGAFAKSQFGQALLSAAGKKTAGEEKLDELDSKLTKMEKDMNEILEIYKSMGAGQEEGGKKGNGNNKLKKIKNLGQFVKRASVMRKLQPVKEPEVLENEIKSEDN